MPGEYKKMRAVRSKEIEEGGGDGMWETGQQRSREERRTISDREFVRGEDAGQAAGKQEGGDGLPRQLGGMDERAGGANEQGMARGMHQGWGGRNPIP
eukprot:354094-Chlamydomonas_euryale.AAC.3